MTADERLRRAILNEVDQLYADGYQPLPRRGDQFEQWLFAQRQRHIGDGQAWVLIDNLIDTYQLHADTGTPLDQHCCENGTIHDCYGCYQEAQKR